LLSLDQKETLLLTESDQPSNSQGCPKIPYVIDSDLLQDPSLLIFWAHRGKLESQSK